MLKISYVIHCKHAICIFWVFSQLRIVFEYFEAQIFSWNLQPLLLLFILFFSTKKNWMIFFNDYLVTWWPKSLKWAIKNTVESFDFVVLIYLGKGFFLLIRGDVASRIRRFSISEGKLNLLFVFSWICNSVDASDFNFRGKIKSFTIRFRRNVNLWLRATHEYHKNWAITNSNDSTVSEIRK